jgi:hypothetical protein
MIYFSTKLSKNCAWEINFFQFFRKFSDGLLLFNIEINWDWFKGDHNPQFSFFLVLINTIIVEFRIYNVNHTEVDDDV